MQSETRGTELLPRPRDRFSLSLFLFPPSLPLSLWWPKPFAIVCVCLIRTKTWCSCSLESEREVCCLFFQSVGALLWLAKLSSGQQCKGRECDRGGVAGGELDLLRTRVVLLLLRRCGQASKQVSKAWLLQQLPCDVYFNLKCVHWRRISIYLSLVLCEYNVFVCSDLSHLIHSNVCWETINYFNY